MKAAEHYTVAQELLEALPAEAATTFEEHAANVELITRAQVHAQLALADLVDDLAKAIGKYTGS